MKRVLVICGTSGSGKSTIQKYLQDEYNIPRIITHTTRKMRSYEQNGKDYYFETKESFDEKHYFEKVQYDGNWYGSSSEGLQKAWDKNDTVSIILDTKGALTYYQKLGEQVQIIFVEVSNLQDLKQRLIKRGDDIDKVNQRLESLESIRDTQLPSYLVGKATVIHNDEWSSTIKNLQEIVKKD